MPEEYVQPQLPASRSGGSVHIWQVTLVLGMALRVLLATISIGSNDAVAFRRIADEVRSDGVLPAYRHDPALNHPPAVGLWAAATLQLAKSIASADDAGDLLVF